MNAAELRLGNWIVRGGNGEHYRATAETISDLQYGHINPTPIPLTEEVLLKCGFEKDSPLNHWNYYSIDGVEILNNPKENTFMLDNMKRKKVYVLFLHQLQNLYFALTGQELTYTP